MLTRQASQLITLFMSLLVAGLITGNQVLIAMGLLPLGLFFVGLLFQPVRRLRFTADEEPIKIWKGDAVEITREVTVDGGFGLLYLYQTVPEHFIIEKGNNLRVFFKGWRNRTIRLSFTVRCVKRGQYTLPAGEWEAQHPLKLTRVNRGTFGGEIELTVRPKLLNLRRIRGIRSIAVSPFPVNDVARLGVATTDFREIRGYVYGDPVKNINWKATARKAACGSTQPLVNEYEVEGKKAVWVFLDAGSYLEVGTNVENVFEYCLDAANGVIFYFADRGYRVGMYIYDDGQRLIYPDSGNKQFLRISRELLNLKTSSRSGEFPKAVETCRRYLLGYNPLCIVITRLDSAYSANLPEGILKLRRLRGRRRRKLPVMVIDIPGYNVIPREDVYDENAAQFLRLETRPLTQQLRRLGASVLEWNPRETNFSTALLRQVKTK